MRGKKLSDTQGLRKCTTQKFWKELCEYIPQKTYLQKKETANEFKK